MPASRIVFVIGDLLAEIRRLRPGVEVAPVELRLDEPTFMAVVGEIENHYGDKLPRTTYSGRDGAVDIVAEFGGMRLSTSAALPSMTGGLHPPQEKTSV